MIIRYHKPVLAASLVLAMALTLSCSSDKDDDKTPGGSPGTGGGESVVYGADVPYQNQTYKTVKIGSQTWFQRNLNYAVDGSKCGNGEGLSDANTTACDTYGRLYNWATAMVLPSKCNGVLSTSDVECTITAPNHRGICPPNWHIPSDADWEALMTAVGDSSTAGKYLKATNGWNSHKGESGNGEDKYGFFALPGGIGISYGSISYGTFVDVGRYGGWWCTLESSADNAYYRDMGYKGQNVGRRNSSKDDLQSIRCVQD